MRTDEFDYHLPEELIAQHPVEPRHASRLLVVNRASGEIEHRRFLDLPGYLRKDDIMVANDSRVIPARLFGWRGLSGGKVEALLVRRRDAFTWEALVKPGRRIHPGEELIFAQGQREARAQVLERLANGGRLLRFDSADDASLDAVGVTPLPPYIHAPLVDAERYQTVYARERGSVAAPTAGLHFTPAVLAELQERGIGLVFTTLHIGLDTFRPVQEENIEEHAIHSEYCALSPEAAAAINEAKARGGRVVAIGTTSVRTLESAARCVAPGQVVAPYEGWTELYIYPGYRYRAVDLMQTNFHLPRSTLLMLVSAFAGSELTRRAYAEAIRERYRFYSFGDAMLIL